jgi:hypothetical protein
VLGPREEGRGQLDEVGLAGADRVADRERAALVVVLATLSPAERLAFVIETLVGEPGTDRSARPA